MQDYRRRQLDEDDRRYEGGRQRSDNDRSWRDQGDGGYASPRRDEGQGPHSEMDDARYAGHSDGWRGDEDRGMRAIVLKNHYEWTSGLAYIVRKAVPGIVVFGGLDLNLPVGGINPVAVEAMAL